MFFQSIYQMMSAGTDLNINIRRTDGKLSVAVMPRRTTLKDETGQAIVPLILNGTPMELDGQFLQAVTSPLQRVQEVLVNLETFEKQAQQAASQGKAARSTSSKETKETREKQEKWRNSSNVRKKPTRQEDTRKRRLASGRPRSSRTRTGRNR